MQHFRSSASSLPHPVVPLGLQTCLYLPGNPRELSVDTIARLYVYSLVTLQEMTVVKSDITTPGD